MNIRRMTLAGWLLLFSFGVATACEDPTLPRIPVEEEDDDDDGGEQTGFDLRAAPLFYLV
jgi:hypothetical protein